MECDVDIHTNVCIPNILPRQYKAGVNILLQNGVNIDPKISILQKIHQKENDKFVKFTLNILPIKTYIFTYFFCSKRQYFFYIFGRTFPASSSKNVHYTLSPLPAASSRPNLHSGQITLITVDPQLRGFI